jgi:hypothetical protein
MLPFIQSCFYIYEIYLTILYIQEIDFVNDAISSFLKFQETSPSQRSHKCILKDQQNSQF